MIVLPCGNYCRFLKLTISPSSTLNTKLNKNICFCLGRNNWKNPAKSIIDHSVRWKLILSCHCNQLNFEPNSIFAQNNDHRHLMTKFYFSFSLSLYLYLSTHTYINLNVLLYPWPFKMLAAMAMQKKKKILSCLSNNINR